MCVCVGVRERECVYECVRGVVIEELREESSKEKRIR